MAEANMTMISRAEVTSIITPATGRKALVLDGTTIELGDTGIRDLSGMFDAGKVASGRLTVQRVGNTVTWSVKSLNLAAGVTSIWSLITNTSLVGMLPSGSYSENATLMQSDAESARFIVGNNNAAIHYGISAVNYSGTLTYLTNRAWPTALPGVADGQPVGV